MKAFKYICVAASMISAAGVLTSCSDLDLDPKGILSENTLLKSEEGIKRYLAVVYECLPIEDFNYGHASGGDDPVGYGPDNSKGTFKGEWGAIKASACSVAQECAGRGHENGGNWDSWQYWPYDRINTINNFLEQLDNYAGYYSEEQLQEYKAEGRFLRAFYYFGMVKRYGGVPIVDKCLDPTADLNEITLARSTEYQCWKFIHDDLEFAMENGFADKNTSRGGRYAAAALMSRAMLYAGTVAKYGGYIPTSGQATSMGLMGMPADVAKEFFQYSYDASKFLRDAGYALHDGSDKEKAFVEEFTTDDTEEDIFVKKMTKVSESIWSTSLFHSWDTMTLPTGTGLSSAVGCAIQPTWELVSLYEHPAVVDDNGRPVRFNDVNEFWESSEMEPRARATVFFSGMTDPVSGVVLDFQQGVYGSYPGTAADGTEETNNSVNAYTDQYRILGNKAAETKNVSFNGNTYNDVKLCGLHGGYSRTSDEGNIYTGMCIRKYISNDKDSRTDLRQSHTTYKAFRFGEILLNWAEAAYELGEETGNAALKMEAIGYVNEVRQRAGAHPYTYNGAAEDIGTDVYGFKIDENLQFIRDERARELAFENHRIFDLTRWRVGDKMFLDGKYSHTLSAYKVLDEDKWIFLNEVDCMGRKVNFNRKFYYKQIPGGAISKNSKLIRNDGY